MSADAARPWTIRVGAADLAVVAVLLAGVANAADWGVGGVVSQELSLRAERDEGDQTTRGQGVTALTLGVTALTPTTEWRLSPGLRLFQRIGDLDEDENSFDALASFNASVRRAGPRLSVDASLSVLPEFVGDDVQRFLEIDPPPGETQATVSTRERDVLQITGRLQAGAAYALDARDSISGSVFYQLREFEDDVESLDAFRRYGLSTGFNRRLTPRATANFGLAARRFESDAPDEADVTTLSLSGGMSSQLTPRHAGAASLSVSANEAGDDSDVSLGGSASLRYTLAATTLSIAANQSVEQNDDGDVNQVFALRGNFGHSINSVSRIGVGLGATVETPLFGGDPEDPTFVFSPTYSLSLTEDWTLTTGYTLRGSSDDDLENRVFIRLGRAFSLLN